LLKGGKPLALRQADWDLVETEEKKKKGTPKGTPNYKKDLFSTHSKSGKKSERSREREAARNNTLEDASGSLSNRKKCITKADGGGKGG